MTFSVKTIRSNYRHYLIEAELNDKSIGLPTNHVTNIINYNYEKFFGKAEVAKLVFQINEQGSNQFIVSTSSQTAVSLKTAILLPPPSSSNVRSLHVISESSFIQPLIHDSRTYFAPLV